jgi:hypothetical protein
MHVCDHPTFIHRETHDEEAFKFRFGKMDEWNFWVHNISVKPWKITMLISRNSCFFLFLIYRFHSSIINRTNSQSEMAFLPVKNDAR